MPPKKRRKENRGLPSRWRYYRGAYRYRVPPGTESMWDGKTEFTLGRTLAQAYKVFHERMNRIEAGDNMAQILDRYLAEVTPTKAPRTQKDEPYQIQRLRAIFGNNPASAIKTQHCYQVYESLKKHGLTTANRHMGLLSHVFSMAIKWGIIADHPMTNRKFVKDHPEPKRVYVTDENVYAALDLAPPLLHAYVRLKLATGLRMGDMLSLKVRDWQDDGLHVTPRKTLKSSGKSVIFERGPHLEEIMESIMSLHRPQITEYLFCTRRGHAMIKPDGSTRGFQSMWQRWMARVKAAGITPFTERSLRVKAGSDAETVEDAARLLAHSNLDTARKHYRALPEKVVPLAKSHASKNK